MNLSANQLLLMRLRAQRLIPAFAAPVSAPQVLNAVCGVQAQDLPAAQLAIHIRTKQLTLADIDRARQSDHSIVRTWGVRGTLHLMTVDDARWLIPFLGPGFITTNRPRSIQLGWDVERVEKGLRLLRAALADHESLTREAIIHLLKQNNLPSEGQAPIHLIYRAAFEGILCYGPDQGKKSTFVSFVNWVGETNPLPRETALAKLACRYLAAYGPAAPCDMANWSGLKISEIRDAWQGAADQILPIQTPSGECWMLKTHLPWLDNLADLFPVIRLLPYFDNYLLGYAKRDLLVDPLFANRINAGGGMIAQTLMVNGRILGTWKTVRRGGAVDVIIEPFEDLAPELLPALEQEISAIKKFAVSAAALL